jgi:hypothetical protein
VMEEADALSTVARSLISSRSGRPETSFIA